MAHQNKKLRHKEKSSHGEHVFVKKSLDEKKSIIQTGAEENDTTPYQEMDEEKERGHHFFKKGKNIRGLSKHTDAEISKNLAVIYKNQDGTLPDMKNFQKSRRVKMVRSFFTFLLVGIFSIFLAFGILYVWQGKKSGKHEVVVSVTAEENVKIGQSVTFRLRYRNPQNVPLSKSTVTVLYPEGFIFEKSSVPPTNDSKDEWKLGVIEGNAEGVIDITGRVYGSLGEKQSIRVFFNYLPANFSSEFQKVSTFTLTLGQSPFVLTLHAPPETSYGAVVPIEINLQKEPNFDIAQVALQVVPVEGFVKKSSDPQSDQLSDLVWSVNAKASTSTVRIQGTFLPSEATSSSTVPVIFRVIGYNNIQKTGSPLVLAEATYAPSLFHTALEVQVAVNGATTEANIVPGENMTASFVLKNTGQVAIKNIELAALFNAPAYNKQSILNWKEIQDSHDGTITAKSIEDVRRQGIITWNGKQISELKSLGAGKEIRLDVIIPVKKNSEEADKYKVWDILVSSEARYELNGEKKILSSNPVSVTINSDFAIEVRNEISGEKNDVHTVAWLISNSYHPLKDIELSAEVYGDTEVDESKFTVPAGVATFDKQKKIVKWTIPQMPLGVDVSAFQFELRSKSNNPTQTQLTSKVKVKAFDTVTKKEIILAGDEVLVNVPASDGNTDQ